MPKAAIFALATLEICRAQALPQTGGPPTTRLDGQVASTTGEPLKNATVQLLGQQPAIRPPNTPQRAPDRDSYTVSTDATGRFSFDSLPAGQYSISAKRTGYFPYSGPLLTVDPAKAASLSIRLTPFSRIEGKVTAEDGEPVVGSVSFPGWGTMPSGNSFTIAPDGTYVVSVGPGHFYAGVYGPRTAQTPDGDLQGTWPRDIYVTTYYPSSTTLSGATMLNVAVGAVIRGIDIRARRVTVYTVRGHAINASTGKPAAAMRIVLQGEGDLARGPSAYTEVAADGGFEFKDVQPASYAVSAFNPNERINGALSRLFSLQPVMVGKENVEDLTVTLRPGAMISGTIRMDTGQSVPSSGPGIGVALLARGGGSGGRAQADGSFVIQDIAPGKYVLRVDTQTVPAGVYVKSIRLNQQEIGNQEMVDLTSGVGGTLEVVLSAHVAEISGTIRDASGAPVPQTRVLVWKPGRTTGGSAVQPEGFATTNANGAFRVVQGLAPGEYRVAAWASASDPATTSVPLVPEFLSQFDGAAAAVKVEEDAHATVDAPLIPQDAIDHAAENTRVLQ